MAVLRIRVGRQLETKPRSAVCFVERLMTVYSFVEQVRMHHAIEAFNSGPANITQIALDCGFYAHSVFMKRFKNFTGTTPRRYRLTHQATRSEDRPIVWPTQVDRNSDSSADWPLALRCCRRNRD